MIIKGEIDAGKYTTTDAKGYSITSCGGGNSCITINTLNYKAGSTEAYIDLRPFEGRRRVSTCKNCGAPVHNNYCEYCDTEY